MSGVKPGQEQGAQLEAQSEFVDRRCILVLVQIARTESDQPRAEGVRWMAGRLTPVATPPANPTGGLVNSTADVVVGTGVAGATFVVASFVNPTGGLEKSTGPLLVVSFAYPTRGLEISTVVLGAGVTVGRWAV